MNPYADDDGLDVRFQGHLLHAVLLREDEQLTMLGEAYLARAAAGAHHFCRDAAQGESPESTILRGLLTSWLEADRNAYAGGYLVEAWCHYRTQDTAKAAAVLRQLMRSRGYEDLAAFPPELMSAIHTVYSNCKERAQGTYHTRINGTGGLSLKQMEAAITFDRLQEAAVTHPVEVLRVVRCMKGVGACAAWFGLTESELTIVLSTLERVGEHDLEGIRSVLESVT